MQAQEERSINEPKKKIRNEKINKKNENV